ncbi:MAG: TonB-dependent receptor [Porticoccaceae bacterium]|nr:TonB-dependent receptor [Porticoccaceae bacterium]
MKKLIKLSLGLSLVPFFALSSVNAQEPLKSAEDFSEIEEILVSASLIPIAASQSANAFTVINQEAIQNRAALSLSDLLRDVAGLAVSRSGVAGSLTQIRARGAEANHLLVLIDGVEAGDPSQDDAVNWGTLTSDDIERIEVIKGPQSALYGSDAVSGVVNITTRRAQNPFSASIYSDVGSFATKRNGFNVGHVQDGYDVRFSVNQIETDGENISRVGNEKDGYDNNTYTLSAGLELSEQLDVTISARQSEGFIESDSDNDYDGFVEDQDQVSDFKNETRGIQANYISADKQWQHKLKLSNTSNYNQAYAESVAGMMTSSSKDQYQFVGSKLWDASSQRLSVLLESEKQDFSQQGPLTSWGADPNQDRESTTDSVGVEFRSQLTSKLTYALSVRHDDNSEFDNATTRKLEASYQTEIGRLRGAYGTAIKNPTFSERFGTYTNFIGNSNLQPEKSESWEIGLDRQLDGGDMTVSATIFNAELENEINGFYWAGTGFTAVNKEGLSKRQGVELTASGKVGNMIDLNASYTYTDSVETDGDSYDDEIRRPRHIASLNLAWNPVDRVHINTNIQFNGSQTDDFFGKTTETVTLDSFTLINLSANYDATKNLAVYMHLNNLLDEDYEEVYGYETLGFGLSAGFRYKLK